MSESDWQPTAALKTLKRRAQLLADIRRFFADREVLEVDTPVLSQAAPTATYLDSFQTSYQPPGVEPQTFYLQTSPEFAMKRLLAAGCGDIYQIARVFRNGELGRLHAPEFTMLEWYRPALGYPALMQEVDDLLQALAGFPEAMKMTYQQVFQDSLQVNIFKTSTADLRRLALASINSLPADWQTDRDGWLELLMSECIEPQLSRTGKPFIVYDFPASQAQLAKVYRNIDGVDVAARFEVYAGGLELANGYDECLDADELRQRFQQDNEQRLVQGQPAMPIDDNLLAALSAGMPACTGVALGLERLLMLMENCPQIAAVQSFSFEKA